MFLMLNDGVLFTMVMIVAASSCCWCSCCSRRSMLLTCHRSVLHSSYRRKPSQANERSYPPVHIDQLSQSYVKIAPSPDAMSERQKIQILTAEAAGKNGGRKCRCCYSRLSRLWHTHNTLHTNTGTCCRCHRLHIHRHATRTRCKRRRKFEFAVSRALSKSLETNATPKLKNS